PTAAMRSGFLRASCSHARSGSDCALDPGAFLPVDAAVCPACFVARFAWGLAGLCPVAVNPNERPRMMIAAIVQTICRRLRAAAGWHCCGITMLRLTLSKSRIFFLARWFALLVSWG